MDDIRLDTTDIWMIHKYIRVTYGEHTSTFECHTYEIEVHTTEDIRTDLSDIQMTYDYIQVTCG